MCSKVYLKKINTLESFSLFYLFTLLLSHKEISRSFFFPYLLEKFPLTQEFPCIQFFFNKKGQMKNQLSLSQNKINFFFAFPQTFDFISCQLFFHLSADHHYLDENFEKKISYYRKIRIFVKMRKFLTIFHLKKQSNKNVMFV